MALALLALGKLCNQVPIIRSYSCTVDATYTSMLLLTMTKITTEVHNKFFTSSVTLTSFTIVLLTVVNDNIDDMHNEQHTIIPAKLHNIVKFTFTSCCLPDNRLGAN